MHQKRNHRHRPNHQSASWKTLPFKSKDIRCGCMVTARQAYRTSVKQISWTIKPTPVWHWTSQTPRFRFTLMRSKNWWILTKELSRHAQNRVDQLRHHQGIPEISAFKDHPRLGQQLYLPFAKLQSIYLSCNTLPWFAKAKVWSPKNAKGHGAALQFQHKPDSQGHPWQPQFLLEKTASQFENGRKAKTTGTTCTITCSTRFLLQRWATFHQKYEMMSLFANHRLNSLSNPH